MKKRDDSLTPLAILREAIHHGRYSHSPNSPITWGGSGILVSSTVVDPQGALVVVTRHALELGWLLGEITNILQAPHPEKLELYGRLAMAAIRHQYVNLATDPDIIVTAEEQRRLAHIIDNDPAKLGAGVLINSPLEVCIDFSAHENPDPVPLLIDVLDEAERFVRSSG